MIFEKRINIALKAQYSQKKAMILEKNTIIVKKIQYWKNLPMIGTSGKVSVQSQVV
jgi:hypothetical protein